MTSTATVTIPYTEFEALQSKLRLAMSEATALKKQITEAKIEASDQAMLAIANHALTVTRFAVASLPPESIKDWPYEALREIAKHLPSMPDASFDHDELAKTLEVFALDCERFEMRRRELSRIDPQTLQPMTELVAPRRTDP